MRQVIFTSEDSGGKVQYVWSGILNVLQSPNSQENKSTESAVLCFLRPKSQCVKFFLLYINH